MKLKTLKTEKELYWASNQLDQMLITCYYGERACDYEKDFSWYFNYKYGNCYRFNSKIKHLDPDDQISYDEDKKVEIVQRVGPQNGLRLELYAGQWDISDTLIETGFKILLRNQTDEDAYPEDTGFIAAPDFSTNIIVKPTVVNRLSEPYSNCLTYEKHMYFKINNISKLEYKSQMTCYKICFQKYIFKSCGCADHRLPNNNLIFGRYCFTVKDYYCLYQASLKYYETDIKDCTKACKPDCRQDIYDYSIFTTGYGIVKLYFFTYYFKLNFFDYVKFIFVL
jgi:hypothetical protein